MHRETTWAVSFNYIEHFHHFREEKCAERTCIINSEPVAAVETPVDPDAPPPPTPEVTAKQIAYFEQHLAKLEAEAAKESSSADDADVHHHSDVKAGLEGLSDAIGSAPKAAPSTPAPSTPALGDGMGDMTEDETRAAFNAIRAQKSAVRKAHPDDPFNVVLPEKQETREESSAEDGERVRLAPIAACIETSRYSEAQKEALEEFEENIQGIYQRYVPEMD